MLSNSTTQTIHYFLYFIITLLLIELTRIRGHWSWTPQSISIMFSPFCMSKSVQNFGFIVLLASAWQCLGPTEYPVDGTWELSGLPSGMMRENKLPVIKFRALNLVVLAPHLSNIPGPNNLWSYLSLS